MIHDVLTMTMRLRGGMPAKGWRKPAGYVGYKHKKAQGKKKVELLKGAVIDVGEASDTSTKGVSDDVDDCSEGKRVKGRRGRKKVDYAGMDEDDDDNNSFGSKDFSMDDVAGVSEDDGGDDDAPPPKSSVRAKARVQAERALADSDDDVVINSDKVDDVGDKDIGSTDSDVGTVMELSLTISQSKSHVNPAWAKLMHSWMQRRDAVLQGAIALERGGRLQHLHIQGVLRMRIKPDDVENIKLELKQLLGWKRGDGSGMQLMLKELAVGQVSLFVAFSV